MEIENVFRYTALAVGLKPSAKRGEARLRGLWRIIYSKTIIQPLLIVGVHSGESDVRAMEYLPHINPQRINPQRFMAHARFFVTGVASWDEKELGATPERMQRAVFGFSNGYCLPSG